MRYPSTPCWAGVRPVQIDVSAVAVVDGTTVVIAPPDMPEMVGSRCACSWSAFHPSPSRTSSTTAGRVVHDLGEPVAAAAADQRGRNSRDRRAIESREHRYGRRFHLPENLREHGEVRVRTQQSPARGAAATRHGAREPW